MLKLTDLKISPESLGNTLWLVDVAPAYEYKDGKRTDNISAYRYSLVMVDRGLEKITVKIDGPRQMDKPDGYVAVELDNLEVFIYWSQGQYQVGAKATSIHQVASNSKA
jgi:hypothetical protein